MPTTVERLPVGTTVQTQHPTPRIGTVCRWRDLVGRHVETPHSAWIFSSEEAEKMLAYLDEITVVPWISANGCAHWSPRPYLIVVKKMSVQLTMFGEAL